MKNNYIIISTLIFTILISGCLSGKTITINADNYSKSVIQHVLDISDKNITKYIDSVTVYEDQYLLNEKCRSIKQSNRRFNETNSANFVNYVGCIEIKYNSESENANIDSADMFILSDNLLTDYCDTEGNTVAYFIGYIDYEKKYTSVVDGYYENLYAEEYANKIIKNKCDSEDYLNLENKLKTIYNNYNNSIEENEKTYKLAKDKYDLKWEHYSSIPEDRYSEYKVDYSNYQNSYQKYSETIDNLYQEYSENHNKISEEMNETVRNYRYPFEIVSK